MNWTQNSNSFSAIRRCHFYWVELKTYYYWFDDGVIVNKYNELYFRSYKLQRNMKNKKKVVAKRIIIKIWPRIARDAITLNSTQLSFMAWHPMYHVHIQARKAAAFIIDIWTTPHGDLPVTGKNLYFDPLHLNQWYIYVGRYVSVVVKWVALPKHNIYKLWFPTLQISVYIYVAYCE